MYPFCYVSKNHPIPLRESKITLMLQPCISSWGTPQKNSWSWFSSSFQSNWADEKGKYNHKIDVPTSELINHQSPVLYRAKSLETCRRQPHVSATYCVPFTLFGGLYWLSLYLTTTQTRRGLFSLFTLCSEMCSNISRSQSQ